MINTVGAPKGTMLSDKYRVYVKNNEKKIPLDVYVSLLSVGNGEHPLPSNLKEEFDEIERGTMLSKAYFAILEADERVNITVEFSENINDVDVSLKEFKKNEKEVSFFVEAGEVVTVKINNRFDECIRIISNNIYYPKCESDNFIEFKPGFYNIDNCKYITEGKKGFPVVKDIPDNTTVFIHQGAVVNAAILLEGKKNIKITGGGVISTIERNYGAECDFNKNPLYGPLRKYAYPSIFIKTDSSNITIEGVTLNSEFRGVVIRNSEHVSIRDVKIFTNCINADGINMMNTRKVKIDGCFIHSHDDSIAVFTSCDSILYLGDEECKNPVPISSDIEISNSQLITPCRPFCIGGHATGNTSPHDRVEHIYAHDLDIINYRHYDVPEIERVKKWSGFLRILSQTEQLISDIRFENINCRKRCDYEGQPIHIELRGSRGASYTESSGYRIEKLLFKNIKFQTKTQIDLPSAIYSTADVDKDDYCVDGVVFSNVTFGYKKMENTPEYLEIIGKVKNITVK